MNNDTFAGQWEQLKGKVKKQWGRLTDDDINQIGGNMDELIGRVKTAYGYDKDKAKKEIEQFLSTSSIADVISQIGDKMGDAPEKVKENIEQYSSELSEVIKKSPLKAIAIASAVGLLSGLLLRVGF